MLDIKRIRENPEAVVKALNSRNSGTFSVDHILELDDKRREIIGRVEQLKAKKNQVSKEIPQRKLAGEDLQPLFKEMKEVSEDIKKDDEALADIEKQLRGELLVLPNIPNPDIVLGLDEPGKLDIKAANARVKEICDRYGFDIDPTKKIYDMSVSQKQTVEIVKVLYRGADTLILDEPTAVLTPQETEKLFNVLRNMRADGKAIVIITHKLHEVMSLSD